jgi:hypothetical protein
MKLPALIPTTAAIESAVPGKSLDRRQCLAGVAAAVSGVAAQAAPAMASPSAPIPDSRFPTYVKFAGDPGNGGLFINQARFNMKPSDLPAAPCFIAGFFRAEDFYTFGMLASLGNSSSRGNGLIGLTTQGKALLAFEWFGMGWAPLNVAPAIWPTGSIALGQWSFIALVLNSPSSRDIVMDGVPGANQIDLATRQPQVAPWPTPSGDGRGLAITFGSYYDLDPTKQNDDCHCFNGGLRDWALVTGTPTAAELVRMRNGDGPIAIWGAARTFGYWHFTANPRLGQKEPDVTGHGHDLTYIDAGVQAGHTLPVLVTPASPARPTPAANQ